ncbi:MAG TPA: S26 family signal peptidase [Planctomycetota bacterium]|nr:S26 family signal peptidase [Planctomycetota bacterium]
MGDIVRAAIGYLVVVALIIIAFKFFKSHEKAVIDPNDGSMNAEEYSYGSYSIDKTPLAITDLKSGDVVAIYQPQSKPVDHRVARVVAIEGQRVEIVQKSVKVDGKPTPFKGDGINFSCEFRVPKGCMYVMCDKPAVFPNEPGIGDSLRIGPVPFFYFMGKLK